MAVDHLNLSIEDGEIFGLLGPNGAGKTTTLLMLTTVLKPSEGTAIVGGYDIKAEPDKVRNLIGIAFQDPKLLWVDTILDVLTWHAKVCGLPNPERRRRVEWALKELGLWEFRHRRIHGLSGGMRKRVGIARALVMEPQIMLYDEPSAGLDPIMQAVLDELIATLDSQKGMTSVIVTHDVREHTAGAGGVGR